MINSINLDKIRNLILSLYNSYYKAGHLELYDFYIKRFKEKVPRYIYEIQPTYSHLTLGELLEIIDIYKDGKLAKVNIKISVEDYIIYKTIYLEKEDKLWKVNPKNFF